MVVNSANFHKEHKNRENIFKNREFLMHNWIFKRAPRGLSSPSFIFLPPLIVTIFQIRQRKSLRDWKMPHGDRKKRKKERQLTI